MAQIRKSFGPQRAKLGFFAGRYRAQVRDKLLPQCKQAVTLQAKSFSI